VLATLAAGTLLAGACGDAAPPGAAADQVPTTVAPPGPGTAPPATPALDPATSGTRLAPVVAAYLADHAVPGAVVLARTPEGSWSQAFGTRVVGEDDPPSIFDHWRVGSNTKTMVGTVLLQLVEEGLLSLEDPVSAHRPDVPGGEGITIAQLLDMRSGLDSYTFLESFNQVMDEDPERAWEPEELAALGLAMPPHSAPGEAFWYSNTNTVLAGLIIEALTGRSLAEELEERVFEPLGLARTSFPAITETFLPEPSPNGYLFGTNVSTLHDPALPPAEQEAALAGELLPNDVTNLNPSWGWAAGAAISTAEDLATYVEALVGGGLLGEAMQAERLASVRPTDPANPGFGYGLALASFGPMLGHNGSLPGYQSFMGHDPTTGLTLVVFTNLQLDPAGHATADGLAMQLMAELRR
jgi:D-alanyl-D-alanine carboxypeptidase